MGSSTTTSVEITTLVDYKRRYNGSIPTSRPNYVLDFRHFFYVECCCDEHANTEPMFGVLVHWEFLRVGASVFRLFLNLVPRLSSDLGFIHLPCARPYRTVLGMGCHGSGGLDKTRPDRSSHASSQTA
jgi:hypothetical protein